jgi:hypothetical protein
MRKASRTKASINNKIPSKDTINSTTTARLTNRGVRGHRESAESRSQRDMNGVKEKFFVRFV